MNNPAIKLPLDNGAIDIRYATGADALVAWPKLHEMIESACDETLTARDIWRMVAKHEAMLWIVMADDEPIACAATRRQEKDGNAWLDVMTIGGRDWHRWASGLHDEFVRYAKDTHCDAVTAHVRRGLKKWLERLEWRERQVHMEYRIDG